MWTQFSEILVQCSYFCKGVFFAAPVDLMIIIADKICELDELPLAAANHKTEVGNIFQVF